MKYFKIKLTIFLTIVCFQMSYGQVTQEWAKRYNGPGNSEDAATSLTLDNSGNIYVTGYSINSNGNYDYATIKYNSSGAIQWLKRYNGSVNGNDIANSIAVDNSGNVYVTGSSLGAGLNDDYATIKYNTNGDLIWVKRYNGQGNGNDNATSIICDNSGNVYVTGYSFGNGTGTDYKTIKYNPSGDSIWVKEYNGPGDSVDQATSIAVDNSGNVYITGYSFGNGTDNDYATIKYNSLGIQEWIQRYNGPGNSDDRASSIKVDRLGNVYVTGYWGYATIKYSSSGVLQWVKRYDEYLSPVAYSIAIDNLGNVYVTGRVLYNFGQALEYTTIKYNSSGIQQWIQVYNDFTYSLDEARSITVDSSGNVFITGQVYGDYTTIKYNSAGIQQWVEKYNGLGNSYDEANTIAIDSSGNIFVTGRSYGNSTGYDFATIKYSQQSTNLHLTNLIEGFYDIVANKMVADTVTVNLRNSNSPYEIIDSAKLFLDTNGYTTYSFPNAMKGISYYIVIKHRNSIETWSKQAVLFTYKTIYDFTSSANKAFGDNLVLKGSKYCVYSGDANQDEIIDVADIILVYNDANNSEGGYVKTDLNGDYFVDVSDIIIAYNNTNNVVSVIKP